MDLQHRNSQKRIYVPEACYFVTTVTHERYPYFQEPIFCDLFVKELKMCKQLKQFKLFGWFLGYDHCHLLFQPGDRWNYSEIIHFLKRHVSRNINIIMGGGYDDDKTHEGAVGQPRLHNNHGDLIKFDAFVQRLKTQFVEKYGEFPPFPPFRWQKSFHDHYARNDPDFMTRLGYIEGNPAKHDMPTDWPYVFTNPKYQNLIDEF